jgi:soluble P-type ATPase
MFRVDIPGHGELEIRYLVSDFNGTLATDGRLRPGVKEALNYAATVVDVHVITADTFGLAREALQDVDCTLTILEPGLQATAKQEYVQHLGASYTIALGNGRNDRFMLMTAAIGIAIILEEGASSNTISSADILAKDALSALAYFKEPRRLVATLRD